MAGLSGVSPLLILLTLSAVLVCPGTADEESMAVDRLEAIAMAAEAKDERTAETVDSAQLQRVEQQPLFSESLIESRVDDALAPVDLDADSESDSESEQEEEGRMSGMDSTDDEYEDEDEDEDESGDSGRETTNDDDVHGDIASFMSEFSTLLEEAPAKVYKIGMAEPQTE